LATSPKKVPNPEYERVQNEIEWIKNQLIGKEADLNALNQKLWTAANEISALETEISGLKAEKDKLSNNQAAERQRQIDEAERQRQIDEAERQRQIDEAERQRQIDEAERQRQIDEAERQRQIDEAERQRQIDEAERQRQIDEAERQRQIDEAERQRQIDEAERQRQIDEAERQSNERPERWVNTEIREMSEVHRNSDVVAIWDLHGEYIALKWNMEFAWLAREVNWHLKWTGWNKKVVFQWDILADRWTDWLRIIKEIHNLREQARKQWWDIDIIVGNHDDFMISFLTQRGGVHWKWIEAANYRDQWLWLTELAKFIGREAWDFDIIRWQQNNILKAMRQSPEWRLILEEICNMKLVSQVDDVLYLHTNPTLEILDYLTKWNVQENINLVNQKYQWYLRNTLLWTWNKSITTKEFNKISDIFLDTNNRNNMMFWIEWYCNRLKGSWINMISHGHNSGTWYRNTEIWWVKIVDTDYSYGKKWWTEWQHSVSVVKKEWWVNYIWDNVAYANLEYPIWAEVYVRRSNWWESIAKIKSYDPTTKKYRVVFEEWWKIRNKDVTSKSLRRKSDSEYFNWTSYKFDVAESYTRSNSEKIDNILQQINQENKPEKIRELRDEIEKQYKERKGEEKKLNITDEQLLSLTKIIDLNHIDYIIDWIYYYKTELQPKKYEATHIQETSNRLNELITESDKPKLHQKWFKKEYPDEQCENDVQRFIERAQEKEIAHKQIFLDVGKEANAQALFIWPPKKADRIVDKVKNEYLADWEGWLENITDFTRSTLLFDNYSEFVKWIEVLKQMQKEWRIAKLRIKNRINLKWCNDMLINIETADWYVSEVQFHIPETLILKDGFLWPQVEKLYKDKFNIEFDKYIFTEKIYDLKSDNEYQNKKNKFEKIIEIINNKKNKEFKLPEQWKEIHWHDIYDIKRILEKRQNDPDLIWELDPDDVISLNKTLENISNSLADEARSRYGNRTI
jgi:hypothetical protein